MALQESTCWVVERQMLGTWYVIRVYRSRFDARRFVVEEQKYELQRLSKLYKEVKVNCLEELEYEWVEVVTGGDYITKTAIRWRINSHSIYE